MTTDTRAELYLEQMGYSQVADEALFAKVADRAKKSPGAIFTLVMRGLAQENFTKEINPPSYFRLLG